MSKILLSLGDTLEETRFKDRPNRFVVRCYLSNKKLVQAHLKDPGRLKELLQPGRRVWLQHTHKAHRKTDYSAVLVEDPEGEGLVSLDSTLPNRLIKKALEEKALQEFEGWSLVRPEFKKGSSRFDFLLEHSDGRKMALEVKSVTLVKGRLGLFPDAITARGARHVRELAEIVEEENWESSLLFVVQRQDADSIRADAEIDPGFSKALALAREAGVRVFGRRSSITLQEVVLGPGIPVE